MALLALYSFVVDYNSLNLCRFKSVSDYGSMVRDLRDGKLRDVKIKGQTYRAVSLERKQKKIYLCRLL